MEPTIGIEPMNLFLTKEALYRLSYVGTPLKNVSTENAEPPGKPGEIGAGDETRTRDIQLGRLKLYQLSYSRFGNQSTFSQAGHGKKQGLFKLQTTHSERSRVVPSDPDSKPKSPTNNSPIGWWWGEDLNLRRLRRQIYSLFPLTTREPHQNE